MERTERRGQVFRVWIARHRDFAPAHWSDVPREATALEPVDEALYSAEQAAMFLQGFNEAMRGHPQRLWAVAVPVSMCYAGDAQRGLPVHGHQFAVEPTSQPEHAEGAALGACCAPLSAPLPAGESLAGRLESDHFQGFDQSPQRSR